MIHSETLTVSSRRGDSCSIHASIRSSKPSSAHARAASATGHPGQQLIWAVGSDRLTTASLGLLQPRRDCTRIECDVSVGLLGAGLLEVLREPYGLDPGAFLRTAGGVGAPPGKL